MGTRVFLLATALAVTAFTPAPTVNSISGRVLGPDAPIHGAQITVVDTDVLVRSNQHGEFLLSALGAGEHNLHVVAIGFSPLDTAITVDDQPHRIDLKMERARLTDPIASSGN